MGLMIGIDLGGTKLRTALVVDDGEILAEDLWPSGEAGGVKEHLKAVADRVRVCLDQSGVSRTELQGIGVGCAGQISPDGRRVLFSPNLDWESVPLADALEEMFKVPVIVENDVRAAALGEASFGAGKGCRDLVCIFVGTGVGSGIIIRGKLLRGSQNLAGEVGHMKLDPEGPRCTCGGRGCVEVYAGGGHVRRRALEALEMDKSSRLAQLEEIHVKAVEDAAKMGDGLAKRLWSDVVWSLSIAVCNLTTLLNPRMVILGGGVVEASPILVKRVKDSIPELVTMLSGKQVQVVRAQLGDRAGVIGASRLFHQESLSVKNG